jgi:soluble lytic murein transglycosylase-like protein
VLSLKKFNKNILMILLAALSVAWFSVGPPEWAEGQPGAERVSTSGAPDILLLAGPRSTPELNRFNPHAVLDEVRAAVLTDRIERLLSLYPRFIGPRERSRLATMLVEEGRRSGIDPLFLAAVIRIESAFSTDAVSIKGARGLMQVMPATGELLADRLGIEWDGPTSLHDPETNVRMGVFYLRWLLTEYSGNYRFALTAYNRGPHNVRSIVRRHGRLKSRFTGYFRKIKRAYRRYRRFCLTSPDSVMLHVG